MTRKVRQLTSQDMSSPTSESVQRSSEGMSALPETSGSPDKDGAVQTESAPPKVKTVTPEGADWLNQDPYGLKRAGLYGKKDFFPLQYKELQRHAQFRGAPMGPAELEVIHGPDETAPKDGVNCPVCGKLVTSFVRTALIDRETGDLIRDKDTGNIVYRGQFVAIGPDALNLTVHGAHPGECLFRLRLKRNQDGVVAYMRYKDSQNNERSKPVMLPSQSFDQANARVVGVRASILAEREERAVSEAAMKTRLGFKLGDSHRSSGGRRQGDDGIDRGSFAPKTPRGQSRKQRRWDDDISE